jgi:hypothetical protein
LDGKPCLSPSVLLQTCEDNGIDVSEWYGKANCFVDRHGVDPSYGYFLIDNATRQTLTAITDNPNGQEDNGGAYTVTGGSNKVPLSILFSDTGTLKTIYDMYLRSIVNVTPSLSGNDAVYLVKLEDARFVFADLSASKYGKRFYPIYQWYNRVETYLSPSHLEGEFELDELPDIGRFIYDFDTVHEYHRNTPTHVTIGEKDGVEVEISTPISWEELFWSIFSLFGDGTRADVEGTIFPYWELNNYVLDLEFPDDIFPQWVPQDICLHDRSVRDVLYELLFWSGTSFKYLGEGKFEFFKVEDLKQIVDNVEKSQYEIYLTGLSPFDVKHFTNETGGEIVPESVSVFMEILEQERDDNTKQSYEVKNIYLDSAEIPTRGRKIVDLRMPICWIEERGRQITPSTDLDLPEEEYWRNISNYLDDLFERYFSRFPCQIKDVGGFILSASEHPFIDRISWYSLGGTPGTKFENKVPFEWKVMKPSPVLPREPKQSVIIATVKDDVSAEDQTFEFELPKLLIGQLFNTITAYNTLKRSYVKGEEIVLMGGMFEEWRSASLLIPDFTDDQIYFTVDDLPYLRLKVNKTDLEDGGSSIYQWKVKILLVLDVNGKLPRKTDTEEYIYIKNNPKVVLDDSDTFIYIGYDRQAGSDVYHRWTVADAQNDILFLKGLPGYDQNPEEPTTGERRLVLKSPYSSTEPIGWLEESSDGRTDQELEDFVIQIINENGGTGGGEGGNVIIQKALVNKIGGVAATDATFNFDAAVVLVSDGTIQPDNGTCDNTFATPFVDNEPILIVKKDNGMWTAIKTQRNLIRASPNTDVRGDEPDFGLISITAVVGTAPDIATNPKGKGDTFGYTAGEVLFLEQTTDNKWQVIRKPDITGIFRTTGTITAASYNNTSGVLTIGSGNSRRMVESTTNAGQYQIVSGTTILKNMTSTVITINKIVQAKKIGRYWFVDVEACT